MKQRMSLRRLDALISATIRGINEWEAEVEDNGDDIEEIAPAQEALRYLIAWRKDLEVIQQKTEVVRETV